MRKLHAVRKDTCPDHPLTACGLRFATKHTYNTALKRDKKYINCTHCLRMLK